MQTQSPVAVDPISGRNTGGKREKVFSAIGQVSYLRNKAHGRDFEPF